MFALGRPSVGFIINPSSCLSIVSSLAPVPAHHSGQVYSFALPYFYFTTLLRLLHHAMLPEKSRINKQVCGLRPFGAKASLKNDHKNNVMINRPHFDPSKTDL